jgi:hypothetical protein
MKAWIFCTVAIVISAVALVGCSSAITTTSQEQATSADSAIYQSSTERAQSKCDSSYLYTCDQDGYPMLCDREGNCRSNPAYDAYRYREFAYGQLPSDNGANTTREFQPFPGVPIMTLSF